MATVAQLLGVWQAAMATGQTHHECLGVVERGGLVVEAVTADGGFNHVELFQLAITSKDSHHNCCCRVKHRAT